MRRAALIGVSAAATLALGGTLAACGGDGGKPYVAVGSEAPPGKAVPPHGKVELVPLDGAGETGTAGPTRGSATPSGGGPDSKSGGGSAGSGGATNRTSPPGSTGTPGGGATSGTGAPGNGSGSGTASGGSTSSGGATGTPSGGPTTGTTGGTAGTGGTPSTPAPSTPAPTPAALTLGTPTRTPTPTRRCETVAVPLRNTGGTPVKSGTLTFATHVIGLLGIDWATVTSTQPLAPVAARTATTRTYTVCLDAWRVPLGTHIETRFVTADWR
ncbi:hypothetical protein [Streptomyces sp. TLI_146]|uniref:hypothetical protein n=1 Tax=Streptomyces sp. TLI_146 TaxID=1938858 RepID=UPI000CCB7A80|nr:hypothetical protein [Streptomyces sp. TLI_146]PKV86867.1 hypothetical protein BX283_4441 [Streptomyces sp. TLI_146]